MKKKHKTVQCPGHPAIGGAITERSFEDLMTEIKEWSSVYEISFQFWPKSSYVYVNRDGVEIFDYGGLEIKPTIEYTIDKLRAINPAFYRGIK